MVEIETNAKPKGTPPEFKGDGVAVWVHIDKNGKQFLAIKALQGSLNFIAFKNEPKEEKKEA